jgi:calcineurin-like phosphoesterase family protein
MIYFTSDNHFGHAAIIRFCKRPWTSVEEMNEGMIHLWNQTVTPSDTVVVVGDFAFTNPNGREAILNRLNGTKILVQGNHDKAKITPKGFDLMVRSLEMDICGQKVSVKHYPLRYTGLKQLWWKYVLRRKPKYLHRMLPDKGQFHIHGHTHSKEKFNKNQIHVGVDAWDYKPVSIKQIEKYIHQQRT